MTPLTGIIDSYDIHVPWRNGAINLWGLGCPELPEADRSLVAPLQERMNDLLEHVRDTT